MHNIVAGKHRLLRRGLSCIRSYGFNANPDHIALIGQKSYRIGFPTRRVAAVIGLVEIFIRFDLL